MANKERVVDLAVRARDEYSKVLNNLATTGRKVQLQFAIDSNSAMAKTGAAIRDVQLELNKLTVASGDNREAIGALIIKKGQLSAAYAKLKTDLNALGFGFKANTEAVQRSVVASNAAITANRGLAASEKQVETATRSSITAFLKKQDALDVSANKEARLRQEMAAAQAQLAHLSATQTAQAPFAASVNPNVLNATSLAKARASEVVNDLQAQLDGLARANLAAAVSGENLAAETAAEVPAINQKTDAVNRQTVAISKAAVAQDRLLAKSAKTTAPMGPMSSARGLKGEAQQVSAFGLKPWQLTNLGYQINDVISGVAMGQSPIQILAQQAGQFAQIWPGVMVGLARGAVLFGTIGVAMAPVIAGLIRIKNESDSIRMFSAELALSADGALYNAKALAKVTQEIDKYGVSLDDARKITSAFMQEGIAAVDMAPLAKMAKQLADVTGEKVTDAAARLSKAFSGGAANVRELDRDLNFLTADQWAQIQAMDKAGDSAGAAALAMSIFARKSNDTVQPLTAMDEVLVNLDTAWGSFVDALENSGIVAIVAAEIKFLSDKLVALSEGLKLSAEGAAIIAKAGKQFVTGSDGETPGERYMTLNKLRQETLADINALKSRDGQESLTGANASPNADLLRQLYAQLADIEKRYQAVVLEINGTGDATNEVVSATEEQKKITDEVNSAIEDILTHKQQEIDLAGMTNREAYIQQGIEESILLAKEKQQTLDATALESLRIRLGLMFDSNRIMETARGLEGATNSVDASAQLLRTFEHFTATAYNDPQRDSQGNQEGPNIYRAGYGSNTITLSDGTIHAVTEGMRVSVEDANRDLIRRIGEFQGVVRGQVGVARFDTFTPAQQAALTSIAYNYGSLPERIVEAVRSGTNAEIGTAITGLQNDNGSMNADRRQTEAAVFSGNIGTTGALDAAQTLAGLEADRAKNANDYNEGLAERLAAQNAEIHALSESGRLAAVEKAVREETLTAQKAGVVLSAADLENIKAAAGTLYDRQNIETEVNAIMERRAALLEQLGVAQASNDQASIASLIPQIQQTDGQLNGAIDSAIAFWQAMGGPNADTAILKLQTLKGGITDIAAEMSTNLLPKGEDLNNQIAQIGGSGFSALAESFASGQNAGEAFFNAMINGLADFAIKLGEAIVQQALLNALTGGGANPGGGIGGTIAGLAASLFGGGAIVAHGGGVAGELPYKRMVNPALFATAQRFHSGGGGNLGPDEMRAIVLKSEEIITEDDPRHVRNGGKSGRGSPSHSPIKNVNVFRAEDVLEAAMATEIGEKVMFNFMSRNRRKLGVLK